MRIIKFQLWEDKRKRILKSEDDKMDKLMAEIERVIEISGVREKYFDKNYCLRWIKAAIEKYEKTKH